MEQRRGPRTEPQGAPTLSGKKSWTAQEVRRGSKGYKRKAQRGECPIAKGRECFQEERVVNCIAMLQLFKQNDASGLMVSFGDVALAVMTGAFPVEQWDVPLKELGFGRSKDSERRQLF